MATRIVFLGGHETTVTETEEEVVRAVGLSLILR